MPGPAEQPETRSRRRRRLRLLVLLVVGLPLVAATIVQGYLWSDLPRRNLEQHLTEASGLDVRLGKLTLRWSGRSTVRDATVALPGGDPAIVAPVVDVTHAPVLRVLLGGSLGVSSITGRSPTITLRERADESWEVIDMLAALDADDEPDAGPLTLPQVEIEDALVTVARTGGEPKAYDDVDTRLRSDDADRLAFELAYRDSTCTGYVGLDGTLEHRLEFDLVNAAQLLRPFASLREDAQLNGTWNGRLDGDRLSGNLVLERATSAGGMIAADLEFSGESRGVGPLTITGSGAVEAEAGGAERSASVEFDVRGPGWKELDFDLVLPTMSWTTEQGVIALEDIEIDGRIRGPRLELNRIGLPKSASSRITGAWDLRRGEWSIDFSAAEWIIPRFAESGVDVELTMRGERQAVTIESLHVRGQRSESTTSGTYDPTATPPVRARQVVVLGDCEVEDVDAAGQGDDERGPGVRAEVDVTGTLLPLELNYDGQLLARRVRLVDGAIEVIRSPCRGTLDGRALAFEATGFSLMSGEGSGGGEYTWDDELLAFTLDARAADLEATLARLDAPFGATGALDAKLDFRMPELDVSRLSLEGDWSIRDFDAGLFEADAGSGRVSWQDGTFRLDDGRFEKEDGTVEGTLVYQAETDEPEVSLTCTQWPMDVPEVAMHLVVDGSMASAELLGDGAGKSIRFSTAIFVDGQPEGTVEMDGVLDGWVMAIDELEGTLAGGRISGVGSIGLALWQQTNAELRWTDVDLSRAVGAHEAIPPFAGRSTGSARLVPSTDRRFPDSLAVSISADLTDGRIRGGQLRTVRSNGFIAADRQVVERARLTALGGTVECSGWRSQDSGFAQLFFTVTDLDAQDLATVLGLETARPLVGRLAGRGSLTRSTGDARLLGQADLELTEADLGGSPVVSTMYRAMRLDFSRSEPRGRGSVSLTLDGNRLAADRICYFYRGSAVAGQLTIADLTLGAESPIEGVVVGTIRPFGDNNVPVVRMIDDLIHALQSPATSAVVSGTCGDIQVRLVPFAQLANQVGGLLRGLSGADTSNP
ncbi:MAG: AsmA family protein [Planctomycetota bacterium]|jgi:hypothetical protein